MPERCPKEEDRKGSQKNGEINKMFGKFLKHKKVSSQKAAVSGQEKTIPDSFFADG
jgi:hypothetical protein